MPILKGPRDGEATLTLVLPEDIAKSWELYFIEVWHSDCSSSYRPNSWLELLLWRRLHHGN